MRSAIVAALAIGALAVPFEVRDVVTFVDTVYATEIVTVTETAPSSTASSASSTTAMHYGHHWHASASSTSTSIAVPSSSSSPPPPAPSPASTSAPPPPPPAPASTSAPPPPPLVSTSAAPPPSSSDVAVAPVASPPASSPPAAPTDYAGKSVLHHNLHRYNHSAPDVAWNQSLANTAAKIAQSCVYAHNVVQDGGGYGQNIAAGVEADNITVIITNLFYNGEVGWYRDFYGQAQPDMSNFEYWGHFSQIVWKDTASVGCATQDCSAQGLANVGSNVSPHFTVCNYYPPGNYANEYGTNVGKPAGEATAEWNAGL